MSIINDFVTEYKNSKDLYERVREDAVQMLENKLKLSGILAIVSSRLKNAQSLLEKLQIRSKEKEYLDMHDIEQDIVDLVGLRIALYFPNDAIKVENIINELFDDVNVKRFPSEQRDTSIYKRRFTGYCANHYRFNMIKKAEKDNSSIKCIVVEIQVASLLMHAWSEVEHDLSYKQKKGDPSFDEYESLDEINGLVIAAEISLQRLQRLSEFRITSENKPFTSHYQLASYIYNKLSPNAKDIALGNVQLLFIVLSKIDRLTPAKISNDLRIIDLKDSISPCQQIINYHSNSSATLSNFVISAANKVNHPDIAWPINNDEIGAFIKAWVRLEKLIELNRKHYLKESNSSTRINMNMNEIFEIYSIEPNIITLYTQLKRIRNNLVHGIEVPNSEYLIYSIQQIDSLYVNFKDHFSN